MNRSEVLAGCERTADHIDLMLSALHQRGFTRAEAIALISGMLASSNIYVPALSYGAASEVTH